LPLYEYRCKSCKHQFEKIQKFSDEPIRVCPSCGKEQVEQLISPSAVQFKGSGWYVTDYAHKGFSPSAKSNGDSGSSKPPAPESKPAATSSENK